MIPHLSYNRMCLLLLICVLAGTGLFFLEKKSEYKEEPKTTRDASAKQEIDGGVIIQSARDGWFLYNDSTFPFSLEFPTYLTPKAYADETGDIIVFENTGDPADRNSFQIFIIKFEEELSVLTPERLREDIPDIIIEEPQEAILGDGSRSLIFFSKDPALGKTREVWIVHNMMLYQITARAEADALIADIMKTWKFLQ